MSHHEQDPDPQRQREQEEQQYPGHGDPDERLHALTRNNVLVSYS